MGAVSVEKGGRRTKNNLALNPEQEGYPSPLQSDRGWGGGGSKWEIVDGKKTYPEWYHGLAFTGGTRNWAGEPCGTRQATIDFGEPKTFNKITVWHHGQKHIPKECSLQYLEGEEWSDIDSDRSVDLDYIPPSGTTVTRDVHTFKAVTSRKVRYVFDNCEENILGGKNIHGWIYEFEVFEAPLVPEKISDLPVEQIEGVGQKYGEALRSEGVETILDLGSMELENLPRLIGDTGIPSATLQVCKRRAELALSVRVDPAFDAIQERNVDEVMDSSREELSKATHQPLDAVDDLKRDIATLLCSMDNSAVREMELEQLLMW